MKLAFVKFSLVSLTFLWTKLIVNQPCIKEKSDFWFFFQVSWYIEQYITSFAAHQKAWLALDLSVTSYQYQHKKSCHRTASELFLLLHFWDFWWPPIRKAKKPNISKTLPQKRSQFSNMILLTKYWRISHHKIRSF